jgi:hypothetical protein
MAFFVRSLADRSFPWRPARRILDLWRGRRDLLDRLPPIDPADYAGQNCNPTYAQAGIIGRFFKIGVSYKF